MKHWRSLRFRLFLATTPALLVAFAVALLLLARIFETTTTRQFDLRLSGYLEQVAAVVGSEQMVVNLDERLSGGPFGRPFSGLYWQVQSDGGALHRSRSLWDEKITLPTDAIGFDELHTHETTESLNQRLRVLERRVVAADGTPWRIAVAANRASLDAETAEFHESLTWLGLTLFALAMVIALLQFIVLQRPVAALGRAIEQLSAGHITRLVGSFPSELDGLIGNLNQLIAHNEATAKNARMQATNLAHTIKTPVTILKNEVDRARQSESNPDWSVVLDNLDRIDKMSQFYLTRAQIKRTPNRISRQLHVRPVVFGVVQAVRRLHEHRDVSIGYECDETVAFDGDPTDLEEVLGNVLDNAAKWARSSVRLHCTSNASGLRLIVEDDGPGIPEPSRALIMEPGQRLDETVPGTGFGLAIAAALVRSYGGRLELSDVSPVGLRVTISIPAHPRDGAPDVSSSL